MVLVCKFQRNIFNLRNESVPFTTLQTIHARDNWIAKQSPRQWTQQQLERKNYTIIKAMKLAHDVNFEPHSLWACKFAHHLCNYRSYLGIRLVLSKIGWVLHYCKAIIQIHKDNYEICTICFGFIGEFQ